MQIRLKLESDTKGNIDHLNYTQHHNSVTKGRNRLKLGKTNFYHYNAFGINPNV